MTDTSANTPDAQVARALTALRARCSSTGQPSTVSIWCPASFLSIDPGASDAVHVRTRPGELISIGLKMSGPGRWLTLNLGLGGVGLSNRKVIGFACKFDASEAMSLQVSLRSGVNGGLRDGFFAKPVRADTQTSVHLDMMELDGRPEISATAPWRELVVFFERQSVDFVFHDLRVFIL
ncbi:MAG: hypothetical protein ABI832_03445 [bacterium]